MCEGGGLKVVFIKDGNNTTTNYSKYSKSGEGLSLVMMVNTLEFANDQPIHKEKKRGEEKYFSLPCVLIDSGTMTDA